MHSQEYRGSVPLSAHVPDIGALDLLLSVSRLGSLGKAARLHRISQPAAAARIRNLERLVGLPVIVRSSTGSPLTEQGTVLADWARQVVDAAAALDEGVAALRNQQENRVRLACSMTIAEYLLPGWLAELRRHHPQTTVGMHVLNSQAVAELVRTGSADLGFVEGTELPEGIESHGIAHDHLVVVAAPGHAWACRTQPVTAAELAATPLVTREQGSGTRYTLDHELTRLGFDIRAEPLMELSSTTAIKSAVQAGVGPAVLSSLALTDDIAHGRLAAASTEIDLHRTLRLVQRSGHQLPPVLRDIATVARTVGVPETPQ